MLIYIFFLTLYSIFQLFHQLYLWPSYVLNFIFYLILDTALIYFKALILHIYKSHASGQKSEHNIHPLIKTYQGLILPIFKLHYNLTYQIPRQTDLMSKPTNVNFFLQKELLVSKSVYLNKYLTILYYGSTCE